MYVCYVETSQSSVPHLEFLAAETLKGARQQALACMKGHDGVVSAQLYYRDQLLETVVEEPR